MFSKNFMEPHRKCYLKKWLHIKNLQLYRGDILKILSYALSKISDIYIKKNSWKTTYDGTQNFFLKKAFLGKDHLYFSREVSETFAKPFKNLQFLLKLQENQENY